MEINPDSGEIITLPEAQEYVQAYHQKYPENTRAYFAGIEKIKAILDQEHCIGIRIYNGYDSKTEKTNLVLVGVDKNRRDMTDGIIVERLKPCPDICDINSPLNY